MNHPSLSDLCCIGRLQRLSRNVSALNATAAASARRHLIVTAWQIRGRPVSVETTEDTVSGDGLRRLEHSLLLVARVHGRVRTCDDR